MKKFDVESLPFHPSPLKYHDFCIEFRKINKFKLLGHGHFSRVYIDPERNLVYKIGILYNSVFEDPYLQFIKRVDGKNPYFPKVNQVTLYSHEEKDFYIVEMERLEELSFSNVRKLNKESKNLRKELLRLFDYRGSDRIESMWDKRIEKFENNKNSKEFLVQMKKMMYSFNNDMHVNNMMMRKNGQLVITDPVCPAGFKTISRLRMPR